MVKCIKCKGWKEELPIKDNACSCDLHTLIRSKIANYINQMNGGLVKELVGQMMCYHQWEEHGSGFACMECGYYTSGDIGLNIMIKNLNKRD